MPEITESEMRQLHKLLRKWKDDPRGGGYFGPTDRGVISLVSNLALYFADDVLKVETPIDMKKR